MTVSLLSIAACSTNETERRDPGQNTAPPDAGDPGEGGDTTPNGGGTGAPPGDVTEVFYVDPASKPANWVKKNPNDPRAQKIQSQLASKTIAHWFGDWNKNISKDTSEYVAAATAAKKWPLLVIYNMVNRDCGGASAGGAANAGAYRTWISSLARAIGNQRAMVVLEPDALPHLEDCDREMRLDLLRYATEQFHHEAPNARVYIDSGTAKWIKPDVMAERLDAAGVRKVRGFAINVSNFFTTEESVAYGNEVNESLAAKFGYRGQFVIDTSRNGNGSNGEWCNPPHRKIGPSSQWGGGAEALMWIKVIGDSDGPCGVAPNLPSGTFSADLAIDLIDGK
ncbi:glycoside hydrolase family 6 protein [Pendulispora rubella]|uniref:Glucanase n=1 Tax=Pendulispora rubella TaxID=2741070 RepID=A0ABZ2L5Q9_9BACT